MAFTLDKNEEAYLRALWKEDPKCENWTASYRTCLGTLAQGGDQLVANPAGAFAVAKNLYRRKLLDKVGGRASEFDNGYALSQKAIDWLEDNTEKEETE